MRRPSGPTRPSSRGAGGVAVLAAVLLGGCQGTPATPAAPAAPAGGPSGGVTGSRPITIDVSLSRCGRGWSADTSGRHEFALRNVDSRSAEVSLIDPDGAVYAELEPLGPGRTGAMSIALGPGRYAFRCALEDADVVTGPTVVVGGPSLTTAPAAPVHPVSQQDLLPATRAYTAYVAGRLPGLTRAVGRITHDLRHRRVGRARRDWLTAHLAYERLGAAYGAFGDADGAINGLPGGSSKGLQDKDFTGFHRVEWDLWHPASRPVRLRDARTLQRAVRGLHGVFAGAQIDPLDVSIRAHEITENAVQFELTGRTDFGSHSSLATVRANLDGTRTVIDLLRPLLRTRYAALPTAERALTQAAVDLDRADIGGRWRPLSALTRPERERIDSDLSELSELLAPIASILEPRRTS